MLEWLQTQRRSQKHHDVRDLKRIFKIYSRPCHAVGCLALHVCISAHKIEEAAEPLQLLSPKP